MTDTNLNADILDLLDGTLEDLADLQKFQPLPIGGYRMGVYWTYPDHEEYVAVMLELKLLEVLDVKVAEEDMPEIGKSAKFYMTLQRKDRQPMLFKDGTPNTIGQGQFKEVLAAMAPVFNPDGTLSNRQMIEASEGCEVVVLLGHRKDKQDKDVIYNTLKSLALA